MIEITISLAPIARIIVYLQSIVFILMGSIIGLMGFFGYLKYNKIETGFILAVLIYLSLVIVFIAFYSYLRYIARDEPQFLIEYIMDTLNAVEYNSREK